MYENTTYDPFGSVVGSEYTLDPAEIQRQQEEEERKRREEEAARAAEEEARQKAADEAVHKQEVITYGDGTQERKTVETIPAGANRQNRVQPVAPEQVFNNMVQAESGGQHYNKQGGILTSPAGAVGLAQVMPATAGSPGYGVAPITPQELATPEGNRKFGERYYQGLLQHFGGDQAKAVAAYNAGPGAVEKNIRANNGQLNVAQLPRETQNYVQKVLGKVVNAVIPSAQAGTLPQGRTPGYFPDAGAGQSTSTFAQNDPRRTDRATPVDPNAVPTYTPPQEQLGEGGSVYGKGGARYVEPVVVGEEKPAEEPFTGQGLRAPTTTTLPKASAEQIDQYQQNQNDPMKLLQMANDDSQPDFLKERARNRAADILSTQRDTQKAEERIKSATPAEAARMMTGKPRDKVDIITKALMFNYLGLKELASAEFNKLDSSATDKMVQGPDGKSYLVSMRGDGSIISGHDADGNKLNDKQLIQLGAGVAGGKPDIVGGTYVNDKTGEVGRVMSDAKTGQSYVMTDAGRKPMAGFRPQSSTGTLDMQRERQNIELAGDWAKLQMKVQGAGPEAANKYLGEFNAKHQLQVPMASISGQAPQIDMTTGQMIQTAPQAAVQTAPAAQQTTAAAPGQATQATQSAAQQAPAQGATNRVQAVSPADIEKQSRLSEKQQEGVIKSNQEFSDKLTAARQTGVSQKATIDRIQSSIDKNPAFWGIDTNSTAWRAFVDLNSTNENRQQALDSFARNLNIPKDKRAEFDQTMNDYRSLQVNAITGSGLSASQTNSEKESQRVVGTVGSLADRPAAAKATLEYAKAKIEYVDQKARAWSQAKKQPGADYADFESQFDSQVGEKIFADANRRMKEIIGGGASLGTTSSGNKFRRIQ
jgi:hypothetical protein